MTTSTRHGALFPDPIASSRLFYWLLLLAFGISIPLIGYGVLPLWGINLFSNLFALRNISLLIALITGSMLYVVYLEQVVRRPQLLIYFMVIGWALVDSWNEVLLGQLGINMHFRPILMMGLGVPAAWYFFLYGKELFKILPHFKYYVAFIGCLIIYFIFYNGHAADLRANAVAWSSGSIGILQLSSYLFSLMGIILSAMAILKQSNVKRFFDRFNIALLISSSFLSLLTVIGYFGLPIADFSQIVDGFHRADGIFNHPNPFSHHQSILLIYFSGLFLYYQGHYKKRVSSTLLSIAIVVNLVAFFLGLSKTAIAFFSLAIVFLFLLNLASPKMRQITLKTGFVLFLLLPVGIWLAQALTDQDFLLLLQSRWEEAKSFTWRKEVWDYLQSGIQGWWILFGHGFTASNVLVFQLTYNNQNNLNPLLLAHNGYLGLLYDMGLLGLLLFMGSISLLYNAFIKFIQNQNQLGRPLVATVITLSIYFLGASGFDEMTYMFDASNLFWIFSTMLYCMALREGHP